MSAIRELQDLDKVKAIGTAKLHTTTPWCIYLFILNCRLLSYSDLDSVRYAKLRIGESSITSEVESQCIPGPAMRFRE